MSRTSPGRAIANVLSLRPEEKISSVIPVRHFEENAHLLMATRHGVVKKTALEQYSRPKSGGIIGMALDEGDDLIGVVLTRPGDEVMLNTRQGMAIRFAESDARAMGRNTRGVKGINLQAGDEVVGLVVADPDGFLLTVCENGYGKRTPFGPNTAGDLADGTDDETPEATEPEGPEVTEGGEAGMGEDRSTTRYRRQRRGGKGVRDIRTTERNGVVVGVVTVHDNDDVMLITMQGMVNRTHASEIRVTGRNTQGVRLMNLNEQDRVASVAKIAREDAEDGEPDAPATEPT
jgi:DNA gyrase subunit A